MKFELFEDLFHTMIKMQPEMSEQMKISHFHSLLQRIALQTFRNNSTANRQTLEDVLVIFRRKYVKPKSQATAKHKWHRLVFDPNTTKLQDFLEKLNQGAKKAFGDNAQKMIDSLLYAKLPPKLKRAVNMARLENDSYDEIVAQLERELEVNAFEESDHLPMASMTSSVTKTKTLSSNAQMSDITCNYCKEKGHMAKDCEKLKKKKEKDAQQDNQITRLPIWDPGYTTTFTTRFRPIPLVDDYNPTYIDPDYGRDPYWDTELYNQDLLHFQYVPDDIDHYNKIVHENPPITHNKKTRALFETWQMNDDTNHPVFPNPLGTENNEDYAEQFPQSLLDKKQFQNVIITKDREPDCLPLSNNNNLKCKKRMLYFPMDFGELTIDGLIDTGALSSAIPEMDLRKI